MEFAYFKTATSGLAEVYCTPDGRINFSALGVEFGLDPTTIKLNGTRFPEEGLISRATWAEIKNEFTRRVKNDGTEVKPVIVTGAAPVPGREKGSTSEPVLDNIFSRLDSISAIVQESLSRTRAASTMNVDDLDQLRRCLVTTQIVPEEEEGLLSSLLGAETEGGLETFWEDGTYELQRREEYLRKFKSMTKSPDIIWTDANAEKIKKRFGGLEFPVVAKNDLLAIIKRYTSFPKIGAVLGIEIKKRLSWRGFRQAEVEFYVWASESMFPFVQLITDMERGVAIYSRNGNDVRYRTLGSMEAVRNFVSGILKSLPPGAGEDDSEGEIIVPDTFPSPSRKRFTPGRFEMSSANPQGGSSSTGRQMAFWSMVAAYQNNLGDVANVRDLDCFNVDAHGEISVVTSRLGEREGGLRERDKPI